MPWGKIHWRVTIWFHHRFPVLTFNKWKRQFVESLTLNIWWTLKLNYQRDYLFLLIISHHCLSSCSQRLDPSLNVMTNPSLDQFIHSLFSKTRLKNIKLKCSNYSIIPSFQFLRKSNSKTHSLKITANQLFCRLKLNKLSSSHKLSNSVLI